MVRSDRLRTPSPSVRTAVIKTTLGKTFEVVEKPREKRPHQLEAAERRRSKDVVMETLICVHVPQRAGRPPKGEEGPGTGSLRSISQAAGGYASASQLGRAAKQVVADGNVRDRRKHNRRDANLIEGQLDAIQTEMYDAFEKPVRQLRQDAQLRGARADVC